MNSLVIRLTFAISLCLVAFICNAQLKPHIEFDKTFGGVDADYFFSPLKTRDGGFLLAGVSWSESSADRPVTFGLSDAWIIKLDSLGNTLWVRTYGGASEDGFSKAIEAYDDGYLLAGNSLSDPGGNKTSPRLSTRDFWVIKIDEDGNKLWEKTFGDGGANSLVDLIKTSDGNYILAGTSINNNQAGTEKDWEDYWVVKIDRNGNKIWSKTYGGNSNDWMSCITACSDGGFILGGAARSGISAEKSETYFGIEQHVDYWVVKINSEGEKEWDRTFGGDYSDIVKAIEEVQGGYLIGGETLSPASGNKTTALIGANDLWFIKLDYSGSFLWQKRIGGNDQETFENMSKSPDGNLMLFGTSWSGPGYEKTSSAKGKGDIWVVKINEEADVLWDISLGGSDGELGTDGVILSDSAFLITGYSLSNISGDKSENNKGLVDGWVVKVLMKDYYCPSVDLGKDTTLCLGEVLELRANPGALAYEWNDDDTQFNPSFLVDEAGEYSVSVTYSDCISMDSIRVDYTSSFCSAIIPNVITPNGDDFNDSFVIDLQGPWYVVIKNRYGQTLYENYDYQNDWKADGLPSGIYYYRVLNDSKLREFKGWLKVIK